jgi:adenine-specific DNA-methyltransferase
MLVPLNPQQKRRFGCYMTPQPVADLMARLLAPRLGPASWVIDPAAGNGGLLEAIARQSTPVARKRLVGVELQPDLAGSICRDFRVVEGDALPFLSPRSRTPLGAQTFAAVIGNPPYVREKLHRTAFVGLRSSPMWEPYLKPRQDLQQLFLVLGLSLLEPGGDLVYLVNPYWLQSDSGVAVRTFAMEKADLVTAIDFGNVALFPEARGQHSLLVHFRDKRTPAAGAEMTYIRVTRTPSGGVDELCKGIGGAVAGSSVPDYLERSTANTVRVIGPRRRWYIRPSGDARLDRLEARSVPLGSVFSTHQGIVSGADRVTTRNRVFIEEAVSLGEGIFVLSAEELAELGLSPGELAIARPTFRARRIQPFRVDEAESFVLYMARGEGLDGRPRIARHLERFRPLLARRRECRQGKIPWYSLHWPRNPDLFDRPRLVTPRRATEPRFSLAPPGRYEQSDCAMITVADDDVELLRALAVVLNSDLLRLWCRHRGKQKGAVREYFGRLLEEIPLPRAVTDDVAGFRELARFAEPDLARTFEANERVAELWG